MAHRSHPKGKCLTWKAWQQYDDLMVNVAETAEAKEYGLSVWVKFYIEDLYDEHPGPHGMTILDASARAQV